MRAVLGFLLGAALAGFFFGCAAGVRFREEGSASPAPPEEPGAGPGPLAPMPEPVVQLGSGALWMRSENFKGITATSFSASGTLADSLLSSNVSLLGPSIEGAEISDGTIADADIGAAAAIAGTKLSVQCAPGSGVSGGTLTVEPTIDGTETNLEAVWFSWRCSSGESKLAAIPLIELFFF